jgi:hypothetical protein
MGRESYACTTCNRTFSRKNNAERHNKSRHDGMSVIFNKDTGWRSDTTKETKFSFPLSSPHSSFSSSKIATDTTTNNDTISSSGVPYPNNPEDLNIGVPNPEINIKTDDEKFFEIFEKISPLIDELDTLVSAYKSPDEKDKILSDEIMLALMSPNPVRSLKDMINLHRLYSGIKKASESVANSKKITPEQAQLILRTMVLTAPYSKNENKFNK